MSTLTRADIEAFAQRTPEGRDWLQRLKDAEAEGGEKRASLQATLTELKQALHSLTTPPENPGDEWMRYWDAEQTQRRLRRELNEYRARVHPTHVRHTWRAAGEAEIAKVKWKEAKRIKDEWWAKCVDIEKVKALRSEIKKTERAIYYTHDKAKGIWYGPDSQVHKAVAARRGGQF